MPFYGLMIIFLAKEEMMILGKKVLCMEKYGREEWMKKLGRVHGKKD